MGLMTFGRFDNASTGTSPLTAVAGAATTQAGGTPLTGAINVVTVASGSTAVVLPAKRAVGSPLVVHVSGTTTALAYPPVGGAINGGSADASVSIASTKVATFYAHPNGLDYTFVLGA